MAAVRKIMNKFTPFLLLLFTTSLSVIAEQKPEDIYVVFAKKLGANAEHIQRCKKQFNGENVSHEKIKNCLEKERKIEHIEVYGRYVGLEAPEIIGRYRLDKNFIDNAPKNNGDINELIALLPGVQISENAYNVDSAQEIKAQDISISGGQPWQTGFFIDGMNYNSRQDPASASRSASSADDVEGGVQTMNVNSNIVSSITVYDNNIPVEFGNFSGGVVDVETVSPFGEAKRTAFSIGYRGTQSSWGKYHTIIKEEDEPRGFQEDINSEPPQFEKNSYSLQLRHKFNQRHGVLLSLNYLESVISDISLQETKQQERRNTNALIKYSYRKGWLDSLDWSFIYAPYQNKNFIKDTLNSDLTIEGGALGTTINIAQDFSWMYMTSKFSLSQSNNTRKAPAHYYIWLQARGKEWGKKSDGNGATDIPVSLAGGYGDLDKVQTTSSWNTKFSLNDFDLFNTTHNIYVGTDIQFEKIQRERKKDSYKYNSALQYSTSIGSDGLNCSGYTLDCVETAYYTPLDQFISELGGNIDLNNTEHLIAYSENIRTTPQYFQSRLVSPQENITADIMRYALYASDSVEIERTKINVAVRAEYDDFFENVNFSPRFSLGIDVFDNGDSMAIFGLNRYYDAGLLTYKIREQQLPSYLQYRPIRDGYLQGWLNSSSVADYKYRYTDVKTPYDDELVIGWTQATNLFGTFSLKYVKRNKHDQLARESETIIGNDGFSYIQVNNAGYGESERFSFAWNAKIDQHSFWFNTSHTENYSNVDSYDTAADQVSFEQLVFYEKRLISKSDLTLIKSNFARPILANMGWSIDWLKNLTTSFTGSYSQGYETAISTGGFTDVSNLIKTCNECEVNSALVPTYTKIKVKSRFLVNMRMLWQPKIYGANSLNFSINISNLFDARTYAIKDGTSGIETGRQFWLGVNYNFN
jgi:hypothetical protein